MSKVSCHICGEQVESKSDLYIGRSQLGWKSAPFHKTCWIDKDPIASKQYRFWRAPYNGELGKLTMRREWTLALVLLIVFDAAIILGSLLSTKDLNQTIDDVSQFFLLQIGIPFGVYLGYIIHFDRLKKHWFKKYEQHLPD